jgi:hypothetical protein
LVSHYFYLYDIPVRIPIDYDIGERSVTFIAIPGPTLEEIPPNEQHKEEINEMFRLFSKLGN